MPHLRRKGMKLILGIAADSAVGCDSLNAYFFFCQCWLNYCYCGHFFASSRYFLTSTIPQLLPESYHQIGQNLCVIGCAKLTIAVLLILLAQLYVLLLVDDSCFQQLFSDAVQNCLGILGLSVLLHLIFPSFTHGFLVQRIRPDSLFAQMQFLQEIRFLRR